MQDWEKRELLDKGLSKIQFRVSAVESESKALKARARALEDRSEELDSEVDALRRDIEEIGTDYIRLDEIVDEDNELRAEVRKKAEEFRRLSDDLWVSSLQTTLPGHVSNYYKKLSEEMSKHSKDLEVMVDEQ